VKQIAGDSIEILSEDMSSDRGIPTGLAAGSDAELC
jgi:hypothetical protein